MSRTEVRPTTEDHLGLTDNSSSEYKQELKGVGPCSSSTGSVRKPVTGGADPFYHNQKTLLLPQRGTAANNPGHYHDGAGGDQDVSGGRVEAGGQQTDVVALFHQRPHSHCQNGPSCQLRTTQLKPDAQISFLTFLSYLYFIVLAITALLL